MDKARLAPLRGVYTALVTPFAGGELDNEAFLALTPTPPWSSTGRNCCAQPVR